MSSRRSSVPLIPRRRLAGASSGQLRSRRRGVGLDVVGARPYRAGDDVRTIDHRISARLSSMHDDDRLVVREYLSEESTRVVIVLDRRASMGLFPRGLPWLSKPAAARESIRVIAQSAEEAHSPAGMLDATTPSVWLAADGRVSRDELVARVGAASFGAPAGSLDEGLRSMLELDRGRLRGAFVFVLSDFIAAQDRAVWHTMALRGLDVVPVVIQDPVWERSFPAVAGALLTLADPASSRTREVWLSEEDVAERRAANEARLRELEGWLASLGLDYVDVRSAEPADVLASFAEWAVARREGARTIR